MSVKVLTTGLRNPSGFTFTCDKSIFISEPGLTDPTIPPPFGTTLTGRISQLTCQGQLITQLDNQLGIQGFPEGLEPENIGLADITELDGRLYVLKDFGPASGLFGPDSITGVYLFDPVAKTLTLIANLAAFDIANSPPSSPNSASCEQLPPPFRNGAPTTYAMTAWRGKLYVTNGHTDTIDGVDPCLPLGQNVSRLVNFSDALTPGAGPCQGAHPVLTGITSCGDFLYVVQLTPFLSEPTSPPGPPMNASIFRVDAKGRVKIIATGYSYGTGVAVDRDGSIYITEFAKFIPSTGVYVPPGRLVRFRPDKKKFEVILSDLTLPQSVHIRGNHLYLLNKTQLGDAGQGELLRINLKKLRLC